MTPEEERRMQSLEGKIKRYRSRIAEIKETAFALAENVYGDDVAALGTDEPMAVGQKIAAALRRRLNTNG